MYVLVIDKLDHEASVPDLAVAMEDGIDLPHPFALARALPPHDFQFSVQNVSETEWQLLRLSRRTKIADGKEACGDCRILTLG
eukprot:4509902-Amphidinium_carterae.1